MRLINTATLEPHTFGDKVPRYAILSHRWHNEPGGEATLQSLREHLVERRRLQNRQRRSSVGGTIREDPMEHVGESASLQDHQKQAAVNFVVREKQDGRHIDFEASRAEPVVPKLCPGLQKLQDFCSQMQQNGYEWAWMDTVCIDKTNLTELSEAINSMFRWYQTSAYCFIFLHDVDGPRVEDDDLEESDWFTRGWTLQELIAPQRAVFVDSQWRTIGSRNHLRKILSKITKIPQDVLTDPSNITKYITAQRLSWAAFRETTRGEDETYCLLGLLEINMPLQYGEGRAKAFERLQCALLEEFDDESLFAWEIDESDEIIHPLTMRLASTPITIYKSAIITGMFAQSPRQFAGGMVIQAVPEWAPRLPNRMSNRGVEMIRHGRVFDGEGIRGIFDGNKACKWFDNRVFAVRLACGRSESTPCYVFLIYDWTSSSHWKNRWRRVVVRGSDPGCFGRSDVDPRKVYIEEHMFIAVSWDV